MVSQREKKLSQIVKKWGRKGRGEYEIYCQLPRCTLHAEKIYKIYWLYQVYLAKGSRSGESLYRYFTDPNPLYCTFSWVFYAKWPLFWLFILFSFYLWVKKNHFWDRKISPLSPNLLRRSASQAASLEHEKCAQLVAH